MEKNHDVLDFRRISERVFVPVFFFFLHYHFGASLEMSVNFTHWLVLPVAHTSLIQLGGSFNNDGGKGNYSTRK